jgi:menaquinone-dependent protoporphyrinogen oxidase
MALDILIVYATKHGSAREIAHAVWDELNEEFDVEIKAADEVHDLEGARAVVLGGSLYMGRWHADSRKFLKRFHKQLAGMPLAIYALGPLKNEEHELADSRKQLDHALDKVSDVHPRSVAVFGGVIDPAQLHFPFNHMPKTDARDWNDINGWARSLPEVLGLVRSKEPVSV